MLKHIKLYFLNISCIPIKLLKKVRSESVYLRSSRLSQGVYILCGAVHLFIWIKKFLYCMPVMCQTPCVAINRTREKEGGSKGWVSFSKCWVQGVWGIVSSSCVAGSWKRCVLLGKRAGAEIMIPIHPAGGGAPQPGGLRFIKVERVQHAAWNPMDGLVCILFSLKQETWKNSSSSTLPKKAVKCLYSESRLPYLRGLWQCLCVLGLNVGVPDIWKLTSAQTFVKKVDRSHWCEEGRCWEPRIQNRTWGFWGADGFLGL